LLDLRKGVFAPETFSNAVLEVVNTPSYAQQAKRFSGLMKTLPGRSRLEGMSPLNYEELIQPLDQTHFDVWAVFILIVIGNYLLLVPASVVCAEVARRRHQQKAKTA
jgi:hypothetical protein